MFHVPSHVHAYPSGGFLEKKENCSLYLVPFLSKRGQGLFWNLARCVVMWPGQSDGGFNARCNYYFGCMIPIAHRVPLSIFLLIWGRFLFFPRLTLKNTDTDKPWAAISKQAIGVECRWMEITGDTKEEERQWPEREEAHRETTETRRKLWDDLLWAYKSG